MSAPSTVHFRRALRFVSLLVIAISWAIPARAARTDDTPIVYLVPIGDTAKHVRALSEYYGQALQIRVETRAPDCSPAATRPCTVAGYRDRNGREVRMAFDQAKNLTRIETPARQFIEIGYDDSNRIVESSKPPSSSATPTASDSVASGSRAGLAIARAMPTRSSPPVRTNARRSGGRGFAATPRGLRRPGKQSTSLLASGFLDPSRKSP